MTVRVHRRPGRPPGGQPVVDRELLLDAAERVIARDGSGASLDAIAAEAGVTKPIVYARIGRRAELSDALAARLAERLVEAASQAATDDPPGDRRQLTAFFRATFETIGANRELFWYVTRGVNDDTPDRVLYLASRSATPLAQFLAEWRLAQGRDPEAALPWAYGIIGMLNMAALWWLHEGDRSAATLAEQLAELVHAGLGPHP